MKYLKRILEMNEETYMKLPLILIAWKSSLLAILLVTLFEMMKILKIGFH